MTKYRGFGAELLLGDGATPTEIFSAIAQLRDIPGPGWRRGVIDATTHDSEGEFQDIVSSFKEGQDMVVPALFDPADPSHDPEAAGSIYAAFDDGLSHNFRIVMPTNPVFTVQVAMITLGWEHAFPIGDMMSVQLTFHPTGAPDWNPA